MMRFGNHDHFFPFSDSSFVFLDSAPKPTTVKPIQEVQKAAVGAFAAFTIASSVFTVAIPSVNALPPAFFSSSTMVSEKVIKEGVYFDYEVDVTPQKYDDARSTFKPASETKSNKGKCVCLQL